MKRTFNSLDQLNKKIVTPPDEPEPEPQPETPPLSSDDAYVLEYFSRGRNASLGGARATARRATAKPAPSAPPVPPAPTPPAEPPGHAKRIAELEARAAEAEAALADAERKLSAACGEQLRLQSECARLAAALAEASTPRPPPSTEPIAVPEQVEANEPSAPESSPSLLSAPQAFAEVFPGELREQLLAALADCADDSARNGRERRAAALSAILAANRPSGELASRRAAIRQILKDAGAYNDSYAIAQLEKLGFRLISGKKHWKLEYADIRFPLAKTPSDHRSHLNTATDIANRCF